MFTGIRIQSPLVRHLIIPIALFLAISPANAIMNGEPDGNLNRNVVALGFDVDGPDGPAPAFGFCTAFIISDRAVVTAAHCLGLVLSFSPNSWWAVTPEGGSPEQPIIPPGVLDYSRLLESIQQFPILVETSQSRTFHIHPQFDPVTRAFDIAVIEFPADTFQEAPVRIAQPGLLQSLSSNGLLGYVPVGLVGYGAEAALDDVGLTYAVPGYRKRGFSAIASISEMNLVLEPTPLRNSINLPGDSGSPVFVSGRAVALTSASSLGSHFRIDRPMIRQFLKPFLRRGFSGKPPK